MKTITPQRYAVKDKSALQKTVFKADEVEPLDGETILQTIEDCADRIMASLEINDCDEQILISLNRNEGMFNLAINKETYALKKGEWERIKSNKGENKWTMK